MRMEHISTESGGHEFAFWADAGCVLFRVPASFAGTGHIESFSGGLWPGIYPALFAVETDGEVGTAGPRATPVELRPNAKPSGTQEARRTRRGRPAKSGQFHGRER